MESESASTGSESAEEAMMVRCRSALRHCLSLDTHRLSSPFTVVLLQVVRAELAAGGELLEPEPKAVAAVPSVTVASVSEIEPSAKAAAGAAAVAELLSAAVAGHAELAAGAERVESMAVAASTSQRGQLGAAASGLGRLESLAMGGAAGVGKLGRRVAAGQAGLEAMRMQVSPRLTAAIPVEKATATVG